MNNRQKYNQMVVKRFNKQRKKEEQSGKLWNTVGYNIPFIAIGYIFGYGLGVAVALYFIAKAILWVWDVFKGAMV